MEHFVVSARKYRPTDFKSVVGQQAITSTLENAIKNKHLAQALLFTGPRGVGKTTCARILAKKLNQSTGDYSEEDFAFNIFELDAASNNSVEDIRKLTEQVRIPPQTGKYKVYIIDEVHMLSQAAFNAFLKTLEEPPQHAIFILATTEKHKIIPTILSRCQIFDFKRITLTDIKNHLAEIAKSEGIDAEDDALHIIAQKADGALRDALSIFDRVVSYTGAQLTRQAVAENLNVLDYTTYFEATDFIIQQDIPGVLVFFNKILADGFDGQHFISGLAGHFRDLLVSKHPETVNLLETGEQIKQQYLEQSQALPTRFIKEALVLANECDLKYRAAKNQRLLVELCLMQLCSLGTTNEKKKPSSYIIPPVRSTSTTTNNNQTAAEVKTVAPTVATPSTETPQPLESTIPVATVQEVNTTLPTPTAPEPTPVASDLTAVPAYSLKSLDVLRTAQAEKESLKKNVQDLPADDFTEAQLQAVWQTYAQLLFKKGEKIVASILDSCVPTIREEQIYVVYPNNTMKLDLERAQHDLLNYLSKQLNNYQLRLWIDVDESVSKRYLVNNREKYDFLKEKHPVLEEMNKLFDFDL